MHTTVFPQPCVSNPNADTVMVKCRRFLPNAHIFLPYKYCHEVLLPVIPSERSERPGICFMPHKIPGRSLRSLGMTGGGSRVYAL